MKILAFDTATPACSVALLQGEQVLTREVQSEREHAQRILPMIDEVLAQAGMNLQQLDAIAFGRGPGGFTGVRLAASVAQGLAFGADLPVLPVSDLRAVAQRIFSRNAKAQHVLVCNDARMQEVYWGVFGRGANGLAGEAIERVSKPDLVTAPGDAHPLYGAGLGFRAYGPALASLRRALSDVDDSVLPRAEEIAHLAAADLLRGGALAAAQALPVYLRDNVAQPRAS